MNSPLLIESKERLPFPDLCIRCGQVTGHKIVMEAGPKGNEKKRALLGCASIAVPVLHIAMLVTERMRNKNVKVPLCWRCHSSRFFPDPKLLLPMLGLLALLGITIYLMFQMLLGTGLLCVLLSIILLVTIVRRDVPHRHIALPLQIFYENGLYSYYVWDGPLYKYLKSDIVQTDPSKPVNKFKL